MGSEYVILQNGISDERILGIDWTGQQDMETEDKMFDQSSKEFRYKGWENLTWHDFYQKLSKEAQCKGLVTEMNLQEPD